MPLFEGMPAFPGDPPFTFEPAARRDRGEPYDLLRLVLGSLTGTPIDPPCHFFPGGLSVDRIDLGTLRGPCRVVGAASEGRTISPRELDAVPTGTARVLLRTSNSDRWAHRLGFFDG